MSEIKKINTEIRRHLKAINELETTKKVLRLLSRNKVVVVKRGRRKKKK